MTGFNHAATGAIIALTFKQPSLALPVAFVSHFLLDTLPHYGIEHSEMRTSKSFPRMLLSDAILLPCLFIGLLVTTKSLLVMGAMVAAISPDLVWFPGFFDRYIRHKPFKPQTNAFTRFHSWIQWGERSWGWPIEILYSLFAVSTLFALR